MDYWQMISYAIAIAIGAVGSWFLIFKKKSAEVKAFMDVVVAAIDDNDVTKEEAQLIVQAFLKIFNK